MSEITPLLYSGNDAPNSQDQVEQGFGCKAQENPESNFFTDFFGQSGYQSSHNDSLPESPMCWCCWENTDTKSNPLIRPCRHCLDPDLQFIHQHCINSYISALPSRANTDQAASDIESGNQQDALYFCTRCRDPYHVKTVTIPRLKVIVGDHFMLGVTLVLLFGIIVMLATLITIIASYSRGQDFIVILWGGFRVSLLAVASVLALAGVIAGGVLGAGIWKSAAGRTRIEVKEARET